MMTPEERRAENRIYNTRYRARKRERRAASGGLATSDDAINLGYRPRAQFVDFHRRKQRWACIVAHRRCGKTLASLMDLIDAALRCDKPDARFAFMSPTYAMAKDSAFQYLKRFTADIPGIEQRESDLMVIFPNGARIRLYGCETYDRLRGIYLDGVILDEAGDMPPQAWPQVIRPALSDRQGWAVFIGTPRGRNEFWRIHEQARTDPAWFSLVLRVSQTHLLPEAEVEDLRRMLTPEAFDAEMECSFDAAILGSYFGKELADAETAGRITSVPYDPAIPVHTAWDIGIGDSTAIWFFQIVRSELHVIDHYEASGFALGHYVDVLKSKPYQYGRDYLPHDAMARELGTGRSIFETMKALSGRHPWIVRKLSIMDGINAARVTLAKTWFDAGNCHEGLEALRAYHAEFDERAKVFSDRPKHDWSSHSADAMRYMSLAWREIAPDKPKPPPRDSWDAAFNRDAEELRDWRVA